MADKKISALPPASTPLAGSEELPIVQGGTTDKVTVANLTAGRDVSTKNLTTTGNVAISTTLSPWSGVEALEMDALALLNGSSNYGQIAHNAYVGSSGWAYKNNGFAYRIQMGQDGIEFYYAASGLAGAAISWLNAATIGAAGNYTPAQAAKGINFTANTPAAGMTSQLLNWYEEGTFTPTQGAGLTVVGAFSSSGKYTRIGRQVTVVCQVNGATSVAAAAGAVAFGGLPFTSSTTGIGSVTNAAINASGSCVASNTDVYSTAIAATTTIYYTLTYFV